MAGKKHWLSITGDIHEGWSLDAKDLALLAEACKIADELAALEKAAKKQGTVVEGSTGQPRPPRHRPSEQATPDAAEAAQGHRARGSQQGRQRAEPVRSQSRRSWLGPWPGGRQVWTEVLMGRPVDIAPPSNPGPAAGDPRVRRNANVARLEGRPMTPVDLTWAQELRRRIEESPLLASGTEAERRAVLDRQYVRAERS